MSSLPRSVFGLLLIAAIVAACSADAGTGGSQTADPVAMAPAHVIGKSSASSTDGTTTTVGDVTRIRDSVVTAHELTNDPRVSGTSTVNLSIDALGDIALEWADATLNTTSGSWTGTCSGAGWDAENTRLTCWFTGNGPYEGLTYFEHISAVGGQARIEGVIAPLPAPTM